MDRLWSDHRPTDVELNLRVCEKRNLARFAEEVAAVEKRGHVVGCRFDLERRGDANPVGDLARRTGDEDRQVRMDVEGELFRRRGRDPVDTVAGAGASAWASAGAAGTGTPSGPNAPGSGGGESARNEEPGASGSDVRGAARPFPLAPCHGTRPTAAAATESTTSAARGRITFVIQPNIVSRAGALAAAPRGARKFAPA